MKHYVILCDWVSDNDMIVGGVDVAAVTHTLERAKEIFARSTADEKQYAKENNWEVFTDTDTEFDAGEEGYYASEHVHFWIQEVE